MDWSDRIGRRIKLRDLHILMAIADTGSMAKAAARLRISHPAVSKAISEIEGTLGVRLLDRGSQGAELTPYGEVLLRCGINVFDEMRQGLRSLQYLSDPNSGEVRLGCTDIILHSLVPPIVRRFSKLHPGVQLDVKLTNPGEHQIQELRESLPDWVRGRGLAMFVTVFFGAMTAGSALWGQLASGLGLPAAHFIAAAGATVGIALTWRWKLRSGAGVDLAPSMHWPAPVLAIDADADRGPVLVTIEYRVDPDKRAAFLVAVRDLGQQRRRDGAYAWDIFEDAAEKGRFLETFMLASWLEHLRQHQRVTNADRVVQKAVREFGAVGEPKVSHFIAAELQSD